MDSRAEQATVMNNIRAEIQEWLEINARVVKNIPFSKEVQWEDIEDVANGQYCQEIKWERYENRTYHWVFSDAVGIDHMCSEILEGDFEMAMEYIVRYRGVILSENLVQLNN